MSSQCCMVVLNHYTVPLTQILHYMITTFNLNKNLRNTLQLQPPSPKERIKFLKLKLIKLIVGRIEPV